MGTSFRPRLLDRTLAASALLVFSARAHRDRTQAYLVDLQPDSFLHLQHQLECPGVVLLTLFLQLIPLLPTLQLESLTAQ